MVFPLAPKASSRGPAKPWNTTVSTAAVTTRRVKLLPMIFWDPSRSPRPSWMEARGAPPMPTRAAKAEMIMMMGRQTPTPVRARAPTVSTGFMCPM